MVNSIYPGTFDPITNGHLDIVQRASLLFDKVTVCIYSGSLKNVIFNIDERVEMFKETLDDLKNIEVIQYRDTLTVDLAKQLKSTVIIRGLRIGADFEYEREMALTNREMNSKIDTVCLISSLNFQYVSSSRVKEIAALGGDASNLVPKHVLSPLMQRINKSV
ncbi:MAG: pantetheine-phosphate adenylyltransferase [Dehalococcoidales bacterium]|nr:pantetheine-phosphate adenylyltransferase [Dehalococcoidales bacterium]